jgi:type IV pilus assembly protein PilF
MKTTMRWAGFAVVLVCVTACAHNSNNNNFKKATPQQRAVTDTQLAIEYMKLNRLAESRQFIELAVQEDPSNANVQLTSGVIYERLRENALAERGFSSAYRIGRKDPNIVNAYGTFLCRTGKAKDGEKLLIEAVNDPVYPTPEIALVNAGQCVRGAGNLVDAERYLNRALAIRPNLPEALLQLGNIAFDRGDAAEAASTVQRYLAVNAPTPEILWLGFRAQRKLGDKVAAAGFARRVQTEFPNSEQAQMMRSGVDR